MECSGLSTHALKDGSASALMDPGSLSSLTNPSSLSALTDPSSLSGMKECIVIVSKGMQEVHSRRRLNYAHI